MSTSQTDTGAESMQRLSTVDVPHIESLRDLDIHFEQTYGSDVLKALKDSNLSQADVVNQLHGAGLNGRSEAVERTYRLHQQEFARKESLLGKTWRWTKEAASTTAEVVAAPFRWTWNSFKAHPVLTTVGVAALAAGGVAAGFYMAGEWELLMSQIPGAAWTTASGVTEELAGATPATEALPGAGMEAITPPAAPLPEL